jgi:hypothetical protein
MAVDLSAYSNAFAVTPSDTVNFVQGAVRAIYVGGAGNVSVVCQAGATPVTFTAPPIGSVIPITCVRVNAALTTATLLVGLQ